MKERRKNNTSLSVFIVCPFVAGIDIGREIFAITNTRTIVGTDMDNCNSYATRNEKSKGHSVDGL